MGKGSTQPDESRGALWERRKGEGGVAHEAFLLYRDLGPGRSLAQVAAARGCQVSLLKRWSAQYDWPARALAWEAAEAREAERAWRQQRRQSLERRAKDVELLEQLCRAFLQGLVTRDAETGKLDFDARVTPRDAIQFYRLAQEIDRSLPQPAEAEALEDEDDPLVPMSNAELREMLAVVRQRIKEGKDDEPVGHPVEAAGDQAAG